MDAGKIGRMRGSWPGLLVRGTVPVWWCALLLTSCVTLDEEDAGVRHPGWVQTDFSRADGNGDGRLSLEELAKHRHREALAEFDSNNDQLISLAEWKQARPNAEKAAEEFATMDANRDGLLQEVEAVRFITGHEGYRQVFRQLDANGDGFLIWEEVAQGEPGALDLPLFPSPVAGAAEL